MHPQVIQTRLASAITNPQHALKGSWLQLNSKSLDTMVNESVRFSPTAATHEVCEMVEMWGITES
ncbi:uncharacterized protein METZ01_LOCUS232157 [marine metagenome]|uniref:Uncharacterized protein n=1 Tax=marine metagenome TaxID=408172 RepID=A0A382GXM4_9ZZZZ